jgi:hypothetical protein
MASYNTYLQQIQRVALAVPAFAGVAMVSARADQAASPACLLVSAAEKYAFRALVDLIPAILQGSQGCGFGWSSFSVLEVLVTSLQILGRVLGA